jgi:hypothetical protein
MSKYYIRMSPDSVDTIYNSETRAETSASMQLTMTVLKKLATKATLNANKNCK